MVYYTDEPWLTFKLHAIMSPMKDTANRLTATETQLIRRLASDPNSADILASIMRKVVLDTYRRGIYDGHMDQYRDPLSF